MIDFAHPYSLEAFKTAFGTNNIESGDLIPITISFDPNRYIPSGSPGIVLKNSLLNIRENQLIRVLFPFPTKKGVAPGTFVDINHKNIYPLPQKNLIKNHKIKVVDEFKRGKLYDIRNYVAINAAITFTFSNLKATSAFWESIPYLCSIYKYTASFYHLGGGRKRRSPEEEFMSFVSFIDLPYCIPVFDYRKIDGMGVCCGFVYRKGYEENGKILYTTTTIDTLYFVLSNHKTNILYMDGVKLDNSAKIDKNILSYMSYFIKVEASHKKQRNSLDKTKKVPQEIDVPQSVFSTIKTEPKNINTANIPTFIDISRDPYRYSYSSTFISTST